MTELSGLLLHKAPKYLTYPVFHTEISYLLNQTVFSRKTQRFEGAGVFQIVGPLHFNFYAYYMVAYVLTPVYYMVLVLKIPKNGPCWRKQVKSSVYTLIIKPTPIQLIRNHQNVITLR